VLNCTNACSLTKPKETHKQEGYKPIQPMSWVAARLGSTSRQFDVFFRWRY